MRVDPDVELPKVMIRARRLCELFADAGDKTARDEIVNELGVLIAHAAEVAAWDMVALIRERELAVEDADDDTSFSVERDRCAKRLQGHA